MQSKVSAIEGKCCWRWKQLKVSAVNECWWSWGHLIVNADIGECFCWWFFGVVVVFCKVCSVEDKYCCQHCWLWTLFRMNADENECSVCEMLLKIVIWEVHAVESECSWRTLRLKADMVKDVWFQRCCWWMVIADGVQYCWRWLQMVVSTVHDDCCWRWLQMVVGTIHYDCCWRWLLMVVSTIHGDCCWRWLLFRQGTCCLSAFGECCWWWMLLMMNAFEGNCSWRWLPLYVIFVEVETDLWWMLLTVTAVQGTCCPGCVLSELGAVDSACNSRWMLLDLSGDKGAIAHE